VLAGAPTPHCACAARRPSADEKVAACLSFAQECIEEAELRSLFTSGKPSIVAYDGFEPSGRMHIAQARRPPWQAPPSTVAGAQEKRVCVRLII
jgi:tyrosyl-tRNA synthetase